MPILLDNVSNALQKVIQPFIQDNFNKSTPLLSNLKRNDNVEFMNNAFYSPVRTSRHGGITNLADDGSTLVSGKASIGQASVNTKLITGTFDISDLTLQATKTTKGAVANMLTFQAETLYNDLQKDINRQYYSDGYGIIGQVSGSVGVGTLSVVLPDSNLDDGRSVDNYGMINGDISPVEYLFADQIIGIGSVAADLGTVVSTSYTSGTVGTVVVTGAPAVVANDSIYRVDGAGAGAGTSEIQGIRLALSTGTANYAGVARSTYGWTPQVGTASQALSLAEMEQQYIAARKFSQSGDRYAIFVNKSLYRKYGDLLTAFRRTVNEMELEGGWKGLSFEMGMGKVGVFLDFEVPDGEVEIINLDSWTVCEVAPLRWLEGPDGRPMIRRRDAITYQATLTWYTNLLCRAPGANARLIRKTT